ncbi:Zc3h12a-like Ribonuclease NYN [Gracilaria domingensis]|nr:Zc3h12a-like Ribonuclease NYN [Gracilaria domingensis]
MISRSAAEQKYDVIIDGLNVGTDDKRNSEFHVERIELALEYFEKLDERVIAVAPPMNHLSESNQAQLHRLIEEGRLIEIEGSTNDSIVNEENLIEFWRCNGFGCRTRYDQRTNSEYIPADATAIITNNELEYVLESWLTGFRPELVSDMRENILIPFAFVDHPFVVQPRSEHRRIQFSRAV